MLWQNRPAVIIGRHQNALEEIDQEYLRGEHIEIVRRISGGGAVYHDLGNLNFTFVTKSIPGHNRLERFAEPVIAALRDGGIHAEIRGRNDLTIQGKKISGNAQFIYRHRILHHGTLLFNTDLDKMNRVLQVDPDKIHSKGVKSTRSRVTNIADHLPAPVSIDSFRKMVAQSIRDIWQGRDATGLTYVEEAAVKKLADFKYRSWEWTYGPSPSFNTRRTARYPWGKIDVRLSVQNGRIESCKIFGDFFSLRDIEQLEQNLPGTPFNRDDLEKRLTILNADQFVAGMDKQHWLELMITSQT